MKCLTAVAVCIALAVAITGPANATPGFGETVTDPTIVRPDDHGLGRYISRASPRVSGRTTRQDCPPGGPAGADHVAVGHRLYPAGRRRNKS